MHPLTLCVLCRRQLTVAGVRKWLVVDEQGDANIVEVCHCTLKKNFPRVDHKAYQMSKVKCQCPMCLG